MKRTLAILLAIAALSLCLPGCTSKNTGDLSSSSDGTQAEASDGLTHITVVLDDYPIADSTFLYMASDLGYYAEENLEVKIITPLEGMTSEQMVATRIADFGICSQLDVISGRQNGLAMKSIGAIVQSPLQILQMIKGNKIYSPSDLYNKKFGYDGTDLQKAMIATVLYGSRRSFMDIDLVDITGQESTALTDGLVDITIGGSLIYDLPVAEENNIDIDWLKVESYSVPSYYEKVFIASDDTISNDPELVSSFLKASARGYTAMCDQREEAIRTLIKYQDAENKPISQTLARTTIYTIIPLMQPAETAFLQQDDLRWQEVIDWMTEWQLIQSDLTLDDVRANLIF